jgi:hypothetical protein
MKANKSENSIDIKTLERFKEKANALLADKYLVLNRQSVSISMKAGEPGMVSTEFPDEEIIKSFLMDVRMFLLKDGNKFNFENVCQFFINNDLESKKASEWLDAYKKLLDQDTMRIRVGQKELTTRMVFHTILNEEHFHQEMDQKGMAVIKVSPLIEPMARMKFFDVLAKLRLFIGAFNKQVVEKYLTQYAK